MKRIAITLILSVIVFVATLMGTNMYVSQKSIEMADYDNAISLDHFQSEFNSNILLTEQSVRSFLTGITSVYIGNDSSTLIIDERELPEFRSRIHENLSQFMKVNKYYMDAMFIIDRDICNDFFGRQECYVPLMRHGDSTLYDLSSRYDFMQSIHFQQIKKEKKSIWTTPSASSPVAGKYMTFFVPINLSNGRFFGAFAISLDIKMINYTLQKHLPYGEDKSSMFLMDEKGNIFSASHDWILDKDYQDEFRRTYGEIRADISESEHQVIRYEGIEYCVYQRKNLKAPWVIYTICERDAIYENARDFNRILFITSFVGMLLMLICSIVISRQIRRNMLQKAAAEEELRMASKVQMSLLKPCELKIENGVRKIALSANMKPAREAGGDLYDYVELPPLNGDAGGGIIFCIGDVSGKGMPAALFMTQVVSLFRNAVQNSYDPSVITAQINNVLAQNNTDMTFCTFFVGVLIPSTNGESAGAVLRFCNAGHNPPVIIKNGEARFMKIKPNLALGLMEGFSYQSETLDMEVGESLLLYTDGITEAKNRLHHDFGEERLLAAVTASSGKVLESLFRDVHAFVGNFEQSDDITMLHISL